MYGRYLSGLGSVDDITGATDYDAAYQDQEPFDIERDEDSYGSGVFDPTGRSGTSNPDMGVFASHYSLPGFVAREVPFTSHRDITDITADADVVTVPGGGMAYVERAGRLSGAAITGPTWRPPILQPPGYTNYAQVYVKQTKGGSVPMEEGMGQIPGMGRVPLNPDAPVTYPVPQRRPMRGRAPVHGVPWQPRVTGQVPFQYQEGRVPKRQIVYRPQIPAPVDAVAHPMNPHAPDMPRSPEVPFRQTVNVGPTRALDVGVSPAHLQMPKSYFPFAGEHRSLGQEEKREPISAMKLALAGAVVGGAVAMFVGATKG